MSSITTVILYSRGPHPARLARAFALARAAGAALGCLQNRPSPTPVLARLKPRATLRRRCASLLGERPCHADFQASVRVAAPHQRRGWRRSVAVPRAGALRL